MRVQDGKTLTTDGPFVSVKEALGGYFVFEADDLDAAIELARAFPPHGSAAPSRSGRRSSTEAMTLEHVPDEWGRVVAFLIGFLGDFDLAEEAAQEAFALAASAGLATGRRRAAARG